MPISIEVLTEERIVPLRPVAPGETISFTDHDPKTPSIILIACNESDDGGLIFRQSNADAILAVNRAFRVVDVADSVPEATIGPGESYELTVQGPKGPTRIRISMT